jgi:hypothetical protein
MVKSGQVVVEEEMEIVEIGVVLLIVMQIHFIMPLILLMLIVTTMAVQQEMHVKPQTIDRPVHIVSMSRVQIQQV